MAESNFTAAVPETDPGQHVDTRKPQRKRQKKFADSKAVSGPKPRRKSGLLKQFNEVPLDIWFEIFRDLLPLDLLRLSRTTKALRAHLLSRSAISVWKSALENAGDLPPRPDDMQEPQFASLIFDVICAGCSASNAKNIVWELRMRYCQKCIVNEEIFFPARKREVPKQLEGIIWKGYVGKGGRKGDALLIHVERTNKLIEEFNSISDLASTAWIEEKKQEKDERQKHASLCVNWETNQRNREEIVVRAQRGKDVMQRLRGLGLGPTIDKLTKSGWISEFYAHPIFEQSRKLTDKGWRGAQQSLVESLRYQERRAANQDRTDVLKSRAKLVNGVLNQFICTFPFDTILPPKGTMVARDDFSSIIFDTPVDVAVDASFFADALARLPEFVSEWRQKAKDKVFDIMRRAEKKEINEDYLLAENLFFCSKCKTAAHYPQVLAHFCNPELAGPYYVNAESPNRASELILIFRRLCSGPSDHSHVVVSQKPTTPNEVFSLCNLDPKTTTQADLDVLNPLFDATSSENVDFRTLLRWRSCFELSYFSKLQFASEKDQFLIEEHEQKLGERAFRFSDTLGCNHCGKAFLRDDLVLHHLPKEHGIESPGPADCKVPIDSQFQCNYPLYIEGTSTGVSEYPPYDEHPCYEPDGPSLEAYILGSRSGGGGMMQDEEGNWDY